MHRQALKTGIKAAGGRQSLRLEKLVCPSPRETEGGTEEGKDTANGLLTCLHTAPSPKNARKITIKLTKEIPSIAEGQEEVSFFFNL